MSIPRIKATYSLDVETMRVLERVATRWGVSKSEALRRAIRASASLTPASDGRVALLEELQGAARLTATAAAAWVGEVRAERRAQRAPSKTKRAK